MTAPLFGLGMGCIRCSVILDDRPIILLGQITVATVIIMIMVEVIIRHPLNLKANGQHKLQQKINSKNQEKNLRVLMLKREWAVLLPQQNQGPQELNLVARIKKVALKVRLETHRQELPVAVVAANNSGENYVR